MRAGGLDHHHAGSAINAADVAPGVDYQAFGNEAQIGLTDIFFQLFQHKNIEPQRAQETQRKMTNGDFVIAAPLPAFEPGGSLGLFAADVAGGFAWGLDDDFRALRLGLFLCDVAA